MQQKSTFPTFLKAALNFSELCLEIWQLTTTQFPNSLFLEFLEDLVVVTYVVPCFLLPLVLVVISLRNITSCLLQRANLDHLFLAQFYTFFMNYYGSNFMVEFCFPFCMAITLIPWVKILEKYSIQKVKYYQWIQCALKNLSFLRIFTE